MVYVLLAGHLPPLPIFYILPPSPVPQTNPNPKPEPEGVGVGVEGSLLLLLLLERGFLQPAGLRLRPGSDVRRMLSVLGKKRHALSLDFPKY